MFQDVPVGVGVIYEGERVRRADMYAEFGGGKVDKKFELLVLKPAKEVEDGKIEVIGPDLKDLEPGKSYPLGILVEVSGEQLEKELEGILEREIHKYLNYIQGVMHVGSRSAIWVRVSKDSFERGLNSFRYVGLVLQRLYKTEYPIVKKIQVTIITDESKVGELMERALGVYEERDARARRLRDEEVGEFYGCILCQSFAPGHVCIITPERPSLCGSVSWLDARAAIRISPTGHTFKVEKGKCLDPVKGEYSGANKAVEEKSLGSVKRVYLHSMFEHPHTSCGCFEAMAFYIPEVDGIGMVHREFKEPSVCGLPFSTLAGQAGGGKQMEGFVGVSIQYIKSPKFLQADGGWRRIVWMPSSLKELVLEFIPEELRNKIATEKEAPTVEELKRFLERTGHPVVERWKPEEAEAECPICGKAFSIRLPPPKTIECPYCGATLEAA